MDSRSKNRNRFDATQFVTTTKALLSALPSDAERAELVQGLDNLIEFLTSLRSAIDSLPTSERIQNADLILEDLGRKLEQIEPNTSVGKILGLTSQQNSSTPKKSQTAVKIAPEEIESIKKLPVEEIRERLSDEVAYPMPKLRGIALNLGIKNSTKTARATLVHEIAMKIANYRGYESLMGKNSTDGIDSN